MADEIYRNRNHSTYTLNFFVKSYHNNFVTPTKTPVSDKGLSSLSTGCNEKVSVHTHTLRYMESKIKDTICF